MDTNYKVHKKKSIKTLVFHSGVDQTVALSSSTQHTIPPEFGRKCAAECLNTRLLLPTLLHAGYRKKMSEI